MGESERDCPCGGKEQKPKTVNGEIVIACDNKTCKGEARAKDLLTVKYIWFNRTSDSLRKLTKKNKPEDVVSTIVVPKEA